MTPRRSRCTGCGATHVLLPVLVLVRRADTAAVIGAALAARAAGAGHRGSPRCWGGRRRRCGVGCVASLRVGAGAGGVYRVVSSVGGVLVLPDPAGSGWADALAAITPPSCGVHGLVPAATSAGAPVWEVAVSVSGGRLLAPGWPRPDPAGVDQHARP